MPHKGEYRRIFFHRFRSNFCISYIGRTIRNESPHVSQIMEIEECHAELNISRFGRELSLTARTGTKKACRRYSVGAEGEERRKKRSTGTYWRRLIMSWNGVPIVFISTMKKESAPRRRDTVRREKQLRRRGFR